MLACCSFSHPMNAAIPMGVGEASGFSLSFGERHATDRNPHKAKAHRCLPARHCDHRHANQACLELGKRRGYPWQPTPNS